MHADQSRVLLSKSRPYRGVWEYLADELERLNFRLAARARQRRRRAHRPLDLLRGLVVSDDEIGGLLEDLAGIGGERTADDGNEWLEL